ncbi:hypothetical protein GX48_01995 [Paracoccidioides brasiliensis]|nr:hypothetical protein GX48_01995 [Paracoccidioides brasiliensis]
MAASSPRIQEPLQGTGSTQIDMNRNMQRQPRREQVGRGKSGRATKYPHGRRKIPPNKFGAKPRLPDPSDQLPDAQIRRKF